MAGAQSMGLTFTDFLAKMKDPAAADLVRGIKSFIRQFEDRASGHVVDPEADSSRVQVFLAQVEQQFRQHPVWRGCQPEVLDQAVEGLEKYVMSKVWRQTFGVWQEDKERDERYRRLMQALSFVDLPTLMGGPVEPDEGLLAMAQSELLKMDRYKAPRDKLLCLVNVKTMIENIVQLAAANGGAAIGGADAFFPVFLFVVVRSRLPHLASNAEYVRRFRSRARLTGQFDYMLCNLESAAMYLDTVGYEHLGVTRAAFLEHLAAAGIPEAHLELRKMQWQEQQQQGADQGADYGVLGGEGAHAGRAALVSPVVDAGDTPPQALPNEAASTTCVREGVPLMADGGRPSPEKTHAAPEAEAAVAAVCGVGSSLTPLPGLEEESPALLAPAPSELRAKREAVQPCELRLDEQDAVTHPRSGAEQQAAAESSVPREVLPRQPLLHGGQALLDELVAVGMQHVLQAEEAGQLQRRYPHMYARAKDLALADVQEVLVGYKELLLRFEALSHAVREHLGALGCSDSMDRLLKNQQQSSLRSISQTMADATDAWPERLSNGSSRRNTSSATHKAAAALEQGTSAEHEGAAVAHQSEGDMHLCVLGQSSPRILGQQPAFFAASRGGSTGAALVDAIDRDSQALSPSNMTSRGAPSNNKDDCVTAAASSTQTQLPDTMESPLPAQPTAQCLQQGDSLPHTEAPDHAERLYFASCTSPNGASSHS